MRVDKTGRDVTDLPGLWDESDLIIQDFHPHDGQEWYCQCARCGSSADFHRCDQCEDGYSDHECGEDCCCCADPELNVICDICQGHEGWYLCMSSPEWCKSNPLPGRESIERGSIQWFVVEPREQFGEGVFD